MELSNVAEFENGRKVFRVTNRKMSKTPVSKMLCGNFIEVGFGYQVEAMWSEMLFNRSFEKAYPITPATYDWFGGWNVVGNDWSKQEWYHSGYQHPRWFACPALDRPESITPDCSFITEKAPFYSLTVQRMDGGVHGKSSLSIHNFEAQRMCGVAQNGKYLRTGQRYSFSGYLKNMNTGTVKAEIRFYPTCENSFAQTPIAVIPLGEVSAEGAYHEAVFDNQDYEGWATFALFITPGHIMADAFSLMPENTVRGWRPDVIEALKRVNPSVLRFPGGCFASLHDWRDGIGPRNSRKPEDSYFWGDINYNDVGTDEFLQLTEALGCEAMLVVNFFHPGKRFHLNSHFTMGGEELKAHGDDLQHITDIDAGVECARQWVEYCNGDITTPMGKLRAENGHPKPYNVKYWEMDNETFRWYTMEEYAHTVIKFSKAMKSVDPGIQIGLCTYHDFRLMVEPMLDICGESVDFLADRVCAPDNIAYKVDIVKRYNETHQHQIYYCDTEALQNRENTLAPFTADFYQKHGITIREARRTWIYGLTLIGNLLNYHRYGDIVRFMCFNNLCNTSGQSSIEVAKEQVILPISGLLFEQMSRSPAAWALEIEGYTPDSLKSIEIQAAWDESETRLIVYLVNKCDQNAQVSLDFSSLGHSFRSARSRRMSAPGGRTQETIRSHGNIDVSYFYSAPNMHGPNSYEIPAFSFTEMILS
jgi:alpha-N-arabinofuranosidase